jgi:colanic acid/amylovoran biosynthesis protein
VLITNCVTQNGGDAAILQALISSLRTVLGEATKLVIVDDEPEQARRLFPDLDVRSRLDRAFGPVPFLRRFHSEWRQVRRVRVILAAWLMGHDVPLLPTLLVRGAVRESLDALRDADAVISTGGTYLVERYQLRGRLLEFEAALAMGRPLILFTQSLGPFADAANRVAVRRTLARARLVLLRDEQSLEHLTDLGLGPNLQVAADGVFALPLVRPSPPSEVRRIAISVREWPFGDNADEANAAYRVAMGRLAATLALTSGTEVTFVSTCQGVPGYWMDDSEVATLIVEDVDLDARQSIIVDRAWRSPAELVEYLARFDLVVATRMHMAILALVAGVPVFPIAYEFKTRELFARLGLGDRVYSFSGVSKPLFVPDVERFILDLPSLTPALWEAVEREHQSAARAARLLAGALQL